MVNRIFEMIENLSICLEEKFLRHLEKHCSHFVDASVRFRCEVPPHLQFSIWTSYW